MSVLGWVHGIGWIVMSLLCLAAVRRRVIPPWLGVMVAVIGGVGPFAGSIGFLWRNAASATGQGHPDPPWKRYPETPKWQSTPRSRSSCPRWGTRSPRAPSWNGTSRKAIPSLKTRRSSRSPRTRSTPRCPPPRRAPWSRSMPPRATPCTSARCSPRSPLNGAAPAPARRSAPSRTPEPRRSRRRPRRGRRDHDARDGRVGLRGRHPRVGQAARGPVEADETIVEISTDKVDAEVPAPARA